MSTQSVIKVRDLSKIYKIRHRLQRNDHPTIRDDIAHFARKPLEWIGAQGGDIREEFWALKNINFDVYDGDVLGLMGPNGSGKSTILKILSRVTKPTSGRVTIHGQASSLLEVGTGFHPELSGRENVYFNGAILGMTKNLIDKKFDDIVAFSEIEEFIDTPVKFYSSGMTVRLAFSVAANLDPEILIIDEVLAVGDLKFKKKSLKRTEEIANGGTTVIFVSHMVGQLKKICKRGIVLKNGEIIEDSDIETGINKYLELNEDDGTSVPEDDELILKGDFTGEVVMAKSGASTSNPTGSGVDTMVAVQLLNATENKYKNLKLTATIIDSFNRPVLSLSNVLKNTELSIDKKQKLRISFKIHNAPLAPGDYKVRLKLLDSRDEKKIYHRIDENVIFTVPKYDFMDLIMESRGKNEPSILTDFDIVEENL